MKPWASSFVDIGDRVYLKLHKCASTSICAALDGDMTSLYGFSGFDGKKVFSATRNPYSRLISCWADRICCRTPWNNSFGGVIGSSMGFYPRMPFDDFARIVCELPDEESDVHFASMCSLVDFFVGRDLDFFLRIENLNSDWDRFGLGGTYPKKEKVSEHLPWQTFYANQKLADMVYDRYRKDFEVFGYDKEEC